VLLQPPGPIETPFTPRTWNSLSEVKDAASAPLAPTKATLRLIIRPSSAMRAIVGKVQRNYVRAFRSVPFLLYVRNSAVLVVMQVFGALFSASFVAYAFARLNWPGRSLAFGLLLCTMMLPGQVTMIPSFLIWRTLGLYNTLTPLWLGAWMGNAFFIFLMTQQMKTIPKELNEAAHIDGLNAFQTWWYIILPQVKPTLAAIAIMTFMGAWNDFMGPLVMLRDQSRFPLSLGLFGMRVDQGGDWTMLMAGDMLMIIPVIVIFFLFQRYFIEGVTVSGMKG
jgi:ABC-type glycerol-3-phosphate transport system permease component